MKPIVRRIVMWLFLLLLVLLFFLCFYASVQHAEDSQWIKDRGWVDFFPHGAQGAQDFFNSTPLIVLWFVLLAMLVGGLFLWKSLLVRPGLLAMHLGTAILIVGGMISSAPAHKLWRSLLRSDRVYEGFHGLVKGMEIQEMNLRAQDEQGRPKRQPLGFTLRLNSFRIAYYPLEVEILYPDPRRPDALKPQTIETTEDWVEIPGSDAQVQVDKISSKTERPFPPQIWIWEKQPEAPDPDNPYRLLTWMELAPGEQKKVTGRDLSFRVASDLRRSTGPVVVLEGRKYGQTFELIAATAGHPMAGQEAQGFIAEIKPGRRAQSIQKPGYADLRLRHKGRVVQHRLRYDPYIEDAMLDVSDLFPDAPGLRDVRLRLGPWMPKDYLSDVSVLVDGEEVRRKVIEVNYPLHYGGYHVYQESYGFDEVSQQPYTLLTFHSDRGWPLAATGLLFMMAGAFWQLWFVPIWRRARRRRHGA